MNNFEEQRARHMALAMEMAPELIARLEWDAVRLHAHRTEALRALVRTAVDLSPWHRKRLVGVCPERLELADLPNLPVMTKTDLMANFDEIVCGDRLTLAAVEDHLEHASTQGYLFDEYTPVATGGSTGQRGVSVWDRRGFAIGWVVAVRSTLRAIQQDEALRGRPIAMAYVVAHHPSHLGAAVARIFSNPALHTANFPVTAPIEDIVAGLNELQPDVLSGYASMLHVLAAEASHGRLRIAPRAVISAGEPLLAEIRVAILATWSAPLHNLWGSTEAGGFTSTCSRGSMHLNEDALIVEPVDADNRPVPPGARAAKILMTNLINSVQPLIRYEISDEVTVLGEACPCGAPTRCVADIQGRHDDLFTYGDRPVHPHVFRTALGRCAGIVEYQVRQTAAGADITVHRRDHIDIDALAREIEVGLAAVGVPDAVVTITTADRLERLPATGKLRRFVPLATQPVSGDIR